MTRINIEIDIAHTLPIGELLEFLDRHGAVIERWEANGPAGGNPCLILSLPTEVHARELIAEYDSTTELDQYLI